MLQASVSHGFLLLRKSLGLAQEQERGAAALPTPFTCPVGILLSQSLPHRKPWKSHSCLQPAEIPRGEQVTFSQKTSGMSLDPCRYPGYPTAAPGVTSRSPLLWVYPSSPISRLLTQIWRCPALNSQSLEELGIPLLLLLFLLPYVLCSVSRRGDAAASFFFLFSAIF